ncbi:MAG: hypothetical protein Q8P64_09550, partial [Deltaproteobacteria bacterium]|nr:hypothetical protein [Deltaproteobacteria bacterium]
MSSEMINLSNDPTSCKKKQYRNRAGVLGGFAGKSPHNAAGIFPKPCSDTFGSWLHAFLGKTGASTKVKSYVTLPFRKIRNCKGLEVPLSEFDIATSGLLLENRYFP